MIVKDFKKHNQKVVGALNFFAERLLPDDEIIMHFQAMQFNSDGEIQQIRIFTLNDQNEQKVHIVSLVDVDDIVPEFEGPDPGSIH